MNLPNMQDRQTNSERTPSEQRKPLPNGRGFFVSKTNKKQHYKKGLKQG